MKPSSNSGRLKTRYVRRLRVWQRTVQLIAAINAIHVGDLKLSRAPAPWSQDSVVLVAQQASIRSLLAESAKFVKSRRAWLTGGNSANFDDAVCKLVRSATLQDSYHRVLRSPQQTSLRAELIVEPSEDHRGVNMLDALPPRDSVYYSSEQNVVEYAGKSMAVLDELYNQFCFIGGSKSEYLNYIALM